MWGCFRSQSKFPSGSALGLGLLQLNLEISCSKSLRSQMIFLSARGPNVFTSLTTKLKDTESIVKAWDLELENRWWKRQHTERWETLVEENVTEGTLDSGDGISENRHRWWQILRHEKSVPPHSASRQKKNRSKWWKEWKLNFMMSCHGRENDEYEQCFQIIYLRPPKHRERINQFVANFKI